MLFGEAVEEGRLRQMTTKLCSCLVLAPFGCTTEEIEVCCSIAAVKLNIIKKTILKSSMDELIYYNISM